MLLVVVFVVVVVTDVVPVDVDVLIGCTDIG